MIDINVAVVGDVAVSAHLTGMTEAVRLVLRQALPQLGAELAQAAAAQAPHRSGKLAKSIRGSFRESGDQLQEAIGPHRFYGRFQESGLDTMRKSARERGITGVRTRLTKGGTVLVSARHGLLSRLPGEHPFHLPAHPFMHPAFESLRARIVAGLTQAVVKGSQA
jgi:HK97 gp10 family phage protein